jgi:hypothetical protein
VGGVETTTVVSGGANGAGEPADRSVVLGSAGGVVGEAGGAVFATSPDGLGVVGATDAGGVVGSSVETVWCTG